MPIKDAYISFSGMMDFPVLIDFVSEVLGFEKIEEVRYSHPRCSYLWELILELIHLERMHEAAPLLLTSRLIQFGNVIKPILNLNRGVVTSDCLLDDLVETGLLLNPDTGKTLINTAMAMGLLDMLPSKIIVLSLLEEVPNLDAHKIKAIYIKGSNLLRFFKPNLKIIHFKVDISKDYVDISRELIDKIRST
jgi:hypothetical protein